ncbi:MAG: hypothetical protein FWD58_03880 [Firmicutes bacterium]|nr:hypothetical protein [Bacillota bacterium]
MAILEKATKNYYKIEFDICAVRGLKVFVNFTAYKSVDEREKEKQREGKWAEFFRKLRESIQTKYDTLLAEVEALGVNPNSVVDGHGFINENRFPELRKKQDELAALAPLELGVGERLFKYGDNEKPALVIPHEAGEQLSALGFDDEWITDPVLLDGGAEVNTGDYAGEPITYGLFYERLKSVMGETVDC